jgi:hypothetical protein
VAGVSNAMNRREIDLDALFDRDADNRLLERRRREELGLPAPAQRQATTPLSFGAESIVEESENVAPRPALLRVALDARPDRGLIPGALVTVVVGLIDEGELDVPDARLRVALPLEAEPIAGSFARDEMPIDGEALLGEGLRLGRIAAGVPVRLRFALRVLPGLEPLDLAAHVSAERVAIVAAPTLRLARRAGHAAYEAPRPFYELELGERDDALATPLVAPEPARAVDVVVDEPVVPEPVVPQPVAAPAFALTAPIGPDELRSLERVFAGGVPHGLAALALLAGIAATGGPFGEALGLESFRTAIAAALPRALVAARMRKPTPPVVTRETLALLRPDVNVAPSPLRFDAPALVTRLEQRDREALLAVLRRDLDEPFLRGVQVLLAIAPRTIEGLATSSTAVRDALDAYRRAAGAWLMRVTVRRAVDRRYDPLTADDATLHAAGQTLVAAFREVIRPT